MKLRRKFYSGETADVAKALIGKVLCRKLDSGIVLKSIITETEAYLGIKDRACHTYAGRRTPRTEVMWGEAGIAYVYFIYGMHYCLNAVTRYKGVPEAVLIRGARPLDKPQDLLNWLQIEPNRRKWDKIMSGPGRLCKTLDITKTQNGLSLRSSELWIEDGFSIPTKQIVKSPRIGIDYTRDDPAGSHQWPLRFQWKPEIDSAQLKEENYESLFRHYKNYWKYSTRQNAAPRKKLTCRSSV